MLCDSRASAEKDRHGWKLRTQAELPDHPPGASTVTPSTRVARAPPGGGRCPQGVLVHLAGFHGPTHGHPLPPGGEAGVSQEPCHSNEQLYQCPLNAKSLRENPAVSFESQAPHAGRSLHRRRRSRGGDARAVLSSKDSWALGLPAGRGLCWAGPVLGGPVSSGTRPPP